MTAAAVKSTQTKLRRGMQRFRRCSAVGKMMTVTYYHHSGFSVASGDVLLVFDYWTGKAKKLPQERQIRTDYLAQFKEVYVFVSHDHEDHFDPIIYTWEQFAPVTYIIADDMPSDARGRRMGPGGEMILSDRVKVKAYGSTDAGVSYLVELDGVRFFHAGDLNYWHWRDVSTVREIAMAEEYFQQEVAKIVGQEIDWCFFPVDPRMGMHYEAGANYFVMAVKPRILCPMHFWGRGDIIREYALLNRTDETEILPLTNQGQGVSITIEDDGFMNISLLNPPVAAPTAKAVAESVSLDGYEGADPFLETDLPVDLGE